MKSLLIILLASSTLLPALGLACGAKSEGDTRTEQSIEQDLLMKIEGKSLICEGNGDDPLETKIDVYAMYRCMNSPVYGELKLDSMPGGSIRVSKITEDETGKLTVFIGDFAEPEICTVK